MSTKSVRENERNEAIQHLRKLLKPGDTVYTVLRHVSRSGMTRGIDCYLMDKKGGEPIWITAYVGKAIDQPQSMEDWRKSRGLRIGGCGMDMGFHVVNSLSYVLYGHEHGYKCLGKGKCPSNYHVNHRDRVRCEGIPRYRVYRLNEEMHMVEGNESFDTRAAAQDFAATLDAALRPEVEADYISCWKSDTIKRVICLDCEQDSGQCTNVEHHQVNGGGLNVIRRDDDTEEVCPICHGEGTIPNPDGPERFDLKHTDGYALRHKWL